MQKIVNREKEQRRKRRRKARKQLSPKSRQRQTRPRRSKKKTRMRRLMKTRARSHIGYLSTSHSTIASLMQPTAPIRHMSNLV